MSTVQYFFHPALLTTPGVGLLNLRIYQCSIYSDFNLLLFMVYISLLCIHVIWGLPGASILVLCIYDKACFTLLKIFSKMIFLNIYPLIVWKYFSALFSSHFQRILAVKISQRKSQVCSFPLILTRAETYVLLTKKCIFCKLIY